MTIDLTVSSFTDSLGMVSEPILHSQNVGFLYFVYFPTTTNVLIVVIWMTMPLIGILYF